MYFIEISFWLLYFCDLIFCTIGYLYREGLIDLIKYENIHIIKQFMIRITPTCFGTG